MNKLRGDGQIITESALAHLSPALYGHVNPYGKYRFDLDAGLVRAGLRPLWEPTAGIA